MKQVIVFLLIGFLFHTQKLFAQNQDSVYSKKWTTNIEINNGRGLGIISTSIGRFANNVSASQLRLSQTYILKKEMQLGMGIGYDRYGEISMLPIYGEFRLILGQDHQFLPYFITRVGYSLGRANNQGLSGRNIGGTMGQIGLGFSFKLRHGRSFSPSINFCSQNFRFDYANRQGIIVHSESVNHSFITFGIGYSF